MCASHVEAARESGCSALNLFAGDQGAAMASVAPHLCHHHNHKICEQLVMSATAERIGFVFETDAPIAAVRKHLRRFLMVRRERDGRIVYFRFYDPEVLEAFLKASNPSELAEFFGPIAVIRTRVGLSDLVRGFAMDSKGQLVVSEKQVAKVSG
jgi:hypothetical protein